MRPQGFGRIVQVAYLVEDIDAAMQHWLEHLGLGPWTCIRNIRLETTYAGHEMELAIHEALAYVGDLQIQLVQSLNPPDEPTPYREWLDAGRVGPHHIAFFSSDIDADLERACAQGFERTCVMQSADGHRYVYCRSTTMPEVWIELLEVYPLLERIFEDGISEAAVWDGTDPIRNVDYSTLQSG
jgi:methylmalonyl-CoA/ethylmalonyl-CoA epimerase